MPPSPADIYIAAFTARCEARRHSGQPAVDQPGLHGLHGLLACAQYPLSRLLVTDDRALDALTALLPELRAGMIDVFAGGDAMHHADRRSTAVGSRVADGDELR